MKLNLKEKINSFLLKNKFNRARKPFLIEQESKYVIKNIPIEDQIKFNLLKEEIKQFESHLDSKEDYLLRVTKIPKSEKELNESSDKFSNFLEKYNQEKIQNAINANQKRLLNSISETKSKITNTDLKKEINELILNSTNLILPKKLSIKLTEENKGTKAGFYDVLNNEINIEKNNKDIAIYRTILHELGHTITKLNYNSLINEQNVGNAIFEEMRAYLGEKALINFVNNYTLKRTLIGLENSITYKTIEKNEELDFIYKTALQYTDAALTIFNKNSIEAFSYFQDKISFGRILKKLDEVVNENIFNYEKLLKREEKINQEAAKYKFKKQR